jgi:hypothetical protein
MELEDFKTAWKKDGRLNMTRDSLLKRIDQIEKSGRKIRRAFIVELAVAGAVCLFCVGMIIFFNGQIQSFMYKLVAITFIAFLPTSYRLYQSQLWINAMDYSIDIRSNLLAFLTYYKTTLKWYWWSSIIVSVLMFIMLFTDEDFLAIGVEWKIGTSAYIILVLLLAKPYLKRVYGKHVQEFETFLE